MSGVTSAEIRDEREAVGSGGQVPESRIRGVPEETRLSGEERIEVLVVAMVIGIDKTNPSRPCEPRVARLVGRARGRRLRTVQR